MITFTYTAKSNETGELIEAEVQADNERSAAKLLIDQNLFPITIESKSARGAKRFHIGAAVRAKERVIFTRQLATLINAGLPLTQSLRTVARQIENPNLREIVDQIVATLEGGSTLANAFAAHPKVFNETYVALVAAGETSGSLDKTLERIASQQEKDAALASKIRGAMVYPLIVLGVITAVLIFMLTTVLPQISGLYADLKKTVPPTTRFLLAISSFITKFWWLVLGGLGAGGYSLRNYFKTGSGGRVADKLKLQAPILGKLLQKVYMARFSSTLSTLLSSGIPVLQALAVVKNSMSNILLSEAIERASDKVKGGKALSLALEEETTFMVLVPQMIKIGEESGQIDDMLEKLSKFYEEEVDQEIKNLSTTIEPALMIVMGLVVAFIIMAILFPIYSLVGQGVAQ